MRTRANVDGNQRLVMENLRRLGDVSVQSLASLGSGVPDLLIGYRGRNYLVELKNDQNPPSGRLLTQHQLRWHLGWYGQIEVAKNCRECLKIIGYQWPE